MWFKHAKQVGTHLPWCHLLKTEFSIFALVCQLPFDAICTWGLLMCFSIFWRIWQSYSFFLEIQMYVRTWRVKLHGYRWEAWHNPTTVGLWIGSLLSFWLKLPVCSLDWKRWEPLLWPWFCLRLVLGSCRPVLPGLCAAHTQVCQPPSAVSPRLSLQS